MMGRVMSQQKKVQAQRVRGRRLARTLQRVLPAAWRSDAGTAAVEFALIVPVLAAMVLGISQASDILVGSSHMETAARASVQYVLNGGTDMTVAQNVGVAAWYNKPSGATLAASEYCTCAGVTAVCTQTCTGGSVPNKYVAVTTTAHLGGTLYTVNKTLVQTARIR